MSPADPYWHDRILREARLKDLAYAAGRELGRMEASALFERRLSDLEDEVAAQKKRMDALWEVFSRAPTERIERQEGADHV